MKKYSVTVVLIFHFFSCLAQTEKKSTHGIGTELGLNGNYGLWGLFYNYNPVFLNKRMEFNAGAGISSSYVLGGGAKYRVCDNNKNLELYVSLNYSYQGNGEARYDAGHGSADYYKATSSQCLHYYLSGRYRIKTNAAVQLNVGYKDNINPAKITHLSGPDENYNKLAHYLNDGILVSVSLTVFFERKKHADKQD
jgi:hypothetical protein